jgi:hypothetical protein
MVSAIKERRHAAISRTQESHTLILAFDRVLLPMAVEILLLDNSSTSVSIYYKLQTPDIAPLSKFSRVALRGAVDAL